MPCHANVENNAKFLLNLFLIHTDSCLHNKNDGTQNDKFTFIRTSGVQALPNTQTKDPRSFKKKMEPDDSIE